MVLLSPCFWLSDKPVTWKVPSPSVWIEMGCMCGNQPLHHWKGSNREDEGHKKVNQETGGLIRLRIQLTLTSLWTSAVLESHQQRPPDSLCVERRATASVKRKGGNSYSRHLCSSLQINTLSFGRGWAHCTILQRLLHSTPRMSSCPHIPCYTVNVGKTQIPQKDQELFKSSCLHGTVPRSNC